MLKEIIFNIKPIHIQYYKMNFTQIIDSVVDIITPGQPWNKIKMTKNVISFKIHCYFHEQHPQVIQLLQDNKITYYYDFINWYLEEFFTTVNGTYMPSLELIIYEVSISIPDDYVISNRLQQFLDTQEHNEMENERVKHLVKRLEYNLFKRGIMDYKIREENGICIDKDDIGLKNYLKHLKNCDKVILEREQLDVVMYSVYDEMENMVEVPQIKKTNKIE